MDSREHLHLRRDYLPSVGVKRELTQYSMMFGGGWTLRENLYKTFTSNIMLHLECVELRVTGDRKLALACVIPT